MTKSSAKQSSPATPSLGANGRAVGLDVHPDTFAAAIMHGRDPLNARVQHSVTRQPLDALCAWARRHTTEEDLLVLEASANTFAVAERLTAIGRQVFILESHRAGQIGKSYLANDRNDAAKIARIYLMGWRSKWGRRIGDAAAARTPLGLPTLHQGQHRARQHLRSFLMSTRCGSRRASSCRPYALARLLA